MEGNRNLLMLVINVYNLFGFNFIDLLLSSKLKVKNHYMAFLVQITETRFNG